MAKYRVWLNPYENEYNQWPDGCYVIDPFKGEDAIFEADTYDRAVAYRQHMAELHPDADYSVVIAPES